MADDALQLIRLRNDFYRDNYRKTMAALLVAVVTVFGLAATLIYEVDHRPQPVYFATTAKGRLIPMIPLNEPYLTQNNLFNFLNEGLAEALNFDFVDYRTRLTAASSYFTPRGWSGFQDILQANLLPTVKDKSLVQVVQPAGSPVILNQQVVDGRYQWTIQEPVVLSYQGAGDPNNPTNTLNFSANYLVTATVRRVSTLENPSGVGISQIIMALQQ